MVVDELWGPRRVIGQSWTRERDNLNMWNEMHDRDHAADLHRRALINDLTYELVPLKSIDAAIEALPAASEVSVTCSPVKGIATTIELTDRVRSLGHRAIPHFAARLVEGPSHVNELARWLKSEGVGQLFLVAGDAETPAGPYEGAAAFLRDLLETDHGLHTIGITGYPDGHALIDDQVLSEALFAKQTLLAEAGIAGYVSTQMCFDDQKIADWIERQRALGLSLPVHLGLPGVVDRSKLMTMGVRLGIGASLRFVKKNRRAIASLLSKSDYDPNDLLIPMADRLRDLGVEGLHCFTFNQVEATRNWQAQQDQA